MTTPSGCGTYQTGRHISTISGIPGKVAAVAFSTNGELIAAGSDQESTVRLFDASTGDLRLSLVGHKAGSGVQTLACQPSGNLLASGSVDNTVIRWDTATGQACDTASGPLGHITSVAFSPDGHTIASGQATGKLSTLAVT